MAYDTLNPLGSNDFRDLSDNATNFDYYSNGAQPAYQNRFGVLKLSIEGQQQEFLEAQIGRQAQFEEQIGAMGYTWVGDYGAGLLFTSRNQYTIRDGIPYAVANDTTLPYTTTGNWATEVSKFKVISADDILRADLAEPDGSALIGYGTGTVKDVLDAVSTGSLKYFENYASMRAYTGAADVVYTSGRQNIFDGAHGFWSIHRTGSRPAEDGGTVLHLDNTWWATRQFQGEVDPIWFGATRSTATPTSTGEDITNAKWNAWPSYVNGATFLAQPGHDWGNAEFLAANKPFSNSDTWDRIAMQLAGWTLKPVNQPDGDYYMSAPIRWHSEMYNTLRGSGIYRCRWHFKDINTHTKLGRVICLLEVFRLGGPPTTFHDFGLIGVDSRLPQPDPANAADNVVTGVSCLNTNGVYFRNMWVSGGGDIGFLFDTSCSYCFVDYCCVEYMGVSVAVGNASVVYVNNCNLWQSFPGTVPCSAVTGFGTQPGEIFLENNVLVGFTGVIVKSDIHKLSWSGGFLRPQVPQPASAGIAISLSTKGSSIKGVNMDLGAGSLSTLIQMGSNTVFSGNEVVGRGFTHALMNISTGVANGATHTRVVDNTFDITGSFSEGYMITSSITGTSYTGGCTKCIFDSNVVVNQASTSLGWSGTNTIGTNQWT